MPFKYSKIDKKISYKAKKKFNKLKKVLFSIL